jgi:hypothetical protein
VPVTVLVLFAAVAIASLLTLGRNRKWRKSQHEMFVATVFVTLSPAFTQVDGVLRHHSSAHKGCSFT